MNFHFPDHRALCMAENATHTLHNLLTLRGALVRDPHVWSQLPDRGDRHCSATAPTSPSPPTTGRPGDRERIVDVPVARSATCTPTCTTRRCGCSTRATPASRSPRMIELPPALEQAWHTHGYYGSVSHNVKAIYQRYMGWFDGNPAQLWPHPPRRVANRYVEAMGGVDRVVELAQAAFDGGDFRWAATLLNHAVFADAGPRGGPRALGRHARTARLRRRERHLAQLLPVGRHRTPRRQLRHPASDGGTRDPRPAHCRNRSSTHLRSRSTDPRHGISI